MKRSFDGFVKSQNFILLVIIILGVFVLGVSSQGNFFGEISVTTFFTFLAVPIMIGLAQMITIAVGQLNLAIGAIGGFAASCAAVAISSLGLPELLGALIAVSVGGLAGVLNGWLVVATKINGFIVTLATMTIFIGAQYALVSTRTIASTEWPAISAIGKESFLGIPVIFLFALVVAGVVAFFFSNTIQGRRLLASGGNSHAAQLAGISNDKSVFIAHALSGLLAGVAALITMASISGINQSVGGDWLLPSFAAPIIGGVALTGGSVAVLGTVLAATVIRLVDSARAEFQLAPAWVNFLVGAVVLGTVALGRVREVRNKKLLINARSEKNSGSVKVGA
jgi:ribose transport system permease protein